LVGSFVFGALKIADQKNLFYEVSIVAFWVFVWGAVEKLFFEMPEMRRSRHRLLRLAGAEVKACEQVDFN